MESAEQYLLAIDEDPERAAGIAKDTAKRLENKELILLSLTKSLGEYLTNDDGIIRAKATGFYAAVLTFLPPTLLSPAQVSVITQFLCDRLEDEAGLKEVTQGLFAVAGMARFQPEDAIMIAKSLFKSCDLMKHPQGTRHLVYQLLDKLMLERRSALKQIGSNFATGFVELVTNEKDPRNLMIVFSHLNVIIVEFDISDCEEVVLDACFCYFPITFKQPPNDPYGITAKDLKDRLKDCLQASGKFAVYLFPQLLEKLDSHSTNTKRDVLQTITACALSYGKNTIANYSSMLWDAIKYEILNASDDGLALEALEAIRAISRSLSSKLINVTKGSSLDRYLRTVTKECLAQLRNPTAKQAKPSASIIAAVSAASAVAHATTFQTVIPGLMTIYDGLEEVAKQRSMLQAMIPLFDATAEVYGVWGKVELPPSPENSLEPFKDKLFEIYSKALMGASKGEVSFRLAGLAGLTKMSRIRNFLADNEIGLIIQFFDEVILTEEKDQLRDFALESLMMLSRLKPSLIMEVTFPAFMAKLPDKEEGEKAYDMTLAALAQLSVERPVFQVLLTRIFNKLNIVLRNKSGPRYPFALVSSILYVLRTKNDLGKDISTHYERIVPELLTRTITPLSDGSGGDALSHEAVLEVTGNIVNLILRVMGAERQAEVLKELFKLFVTREPSAMITVDKELIAQRFNPLEQGTSPQQACTIIIFTSAVAAMRGEVPLPSENLQQFLDRLFVLAQFPYSPGHRRSLLRLIAIIINKYLSAPADREFLAASTDAMWASIKSASCADAAFNLPALFWIAKALALRNDKLAEPIVGRLLELLDDEGLGVTVGRGFEVLLSDDPLLSKENYAVVRLLSKQKLFVYCIPKLTEGFRAASPAAKRNYLHALSNIIRNVPSKLVLAEINTLMPLLLQSLDLPDPAIKVASIDTLAVTVTEATDLVSEHISSLITRLLAASSPSDVNTVRVRTAALRCLSIFPSALNIVTVIPYKRQIMRALLKALDDPKRSVRKEAVDCRARWFALGELKDDD
ncbi:hypothetical protein DRE_04752 [Drechslerella stenobrocha 248]|uniref:MMS19 nucleotide excision repair protein n=1 Tax=Drechslerella stenobrocha 248 TaxID=1043628 RepID=W7HS18_9PEZI|nr:hypothetical protein DRE_04752 [Drechslerella stenobrocha 248]